MTDHVKGNVTAKQKAADKASEKFHNEVTTSLEQLEHPGAKPQKAPEVHKGAKAAVHGAASASKKK
jgi:hypothetical protein